MNEPDNKNTVDLTGSEEVVETSTPALQNFENPVIEEYGSQNVQNPAPDAVRDPEDVTEKEINQGFYNEKVYPVETTIEYLFNPNNKKVFPVNKDIVRQKGLVPCTKEGKLLPDTRRPSDFR